MSSLILAQEIQSDCGSPIPSLHWKICEPSNKGLYQRRIADMKLTFDDGGTSEGAVVW